MDRLGLHALGLCFTINSVFRSAPRIPPTPTNCASRRDQRKTQEAAFLSFSLEPFPPSRQIGRRWIGLDYANVAKHQHQPLRHAVQLRLTLKGNIFDMVIRIELLSD